MWHSKHFLFSKKIIVRSRKIVIALFIKHLLGLLGLLLICSCSTKHPKELSESLSMAGENKVELLKVFERYSLKKDSLKLKAAYFLVENMRTSIFYDGEILNAYDDVFDVLANKTEDWKKKQPWYSTAVNNILDSIGVIYGPLDIQRLNRYTDLTTLSSDFLIKHIDEAFIAWGKPWAKHLTFEQFCEYLLPYRCFDEVPEHWREAYSKKHQKAIDNLVGRNDVLSVGAAVNKIAMPYFSSAFDYFPVESSALNILKGNYGNCTGSAAYKTYAMRSLGIPATIDFIPIYGNNKNKHYWNSTLDRFGNAISFEEPFKDPNSEVVFLDKFTLTKIFRKTFAIQEDKIEHLRISGNDVPPLFRDVKFKDVSNEYIIVSDVKLPLKNKPSKAKYAYLCVFNNQGWEPVHFAKISGDNSAIFTKMGRNVVYAPMYYSNGRLQSAGEAFYISKKGWVQPFEPQIDSLVNLKLTRKYNMVERKTNWMKCLYGGKFQGSNNPDFKDAITLHKIQKVPGQHQQEIWLTRDKAFRYYRFLFNEDRTLIQGEYDGACIAELAFFDENDKKIEGKPVFTDGRENIFYKPENCFDGNPLTFYEDRRDTLNKYIGIDSGKGVHKPIQKITFQARNDMNSVQPGNTYQLLYWKDGRFIPFKTVEARDTMLYFNNVPKNTLYWLRNLNGGREERVFTYKNGKQIWW